MEMKEIGNKVYVKNEISWHIAHYIVMYLGELLKLREDEEFEKGYKIIENAINRHMDYSDIGEIEDMYEIIELKKWKNNK